VTGAAELALSARVRGLKQKHVRDALWKQRTLAKTWTIRNTLHLHPAEELPLWTAAGLAVGPPWHEAYGLTAKQGEKVLAAIGDALDGRVLLREELADEVARRAGEWTREKIASGWGYIIGSAAAVGMLCHGPPRGNKVTFVRTDQWVGWKSVDPEEALGEAYRRYVATYLPAGLRQFAQWFAIKGPDAKRTLGSVEAPAPSPRAMAPGPVRLLPEYDCYVMGFREREHLVPERVNALVKAHRRGRFEGIAGVPTLLIDGVVEGIWRRERRGKKIELEVAPGRRLTAEERAGVEAEAVRIGAFLDAEPSLSFARR
jgi:hypothetical protein